MQIFGCKSENFIFSVSGLDVVLLSGREAAAFVQWNTGVDPLLVFQPPAWYESTPTLKLQEDTFRGDEDNSDAVRHIEGMLKVIVVVVHV